MKQMRSRFRLITLLLVCAFVLTLSLCVGNALKTAGISFSSISIQSITGVTPSPEASVSPDISPSSFSRRVILDIVSPEHLLK